MKSFIQPGNSINATLPPTACLAPPRLGPCRRCSPGVVTLNIDNGYGAACAAMRVLRVMEPAK